MASDDPKTLVSTEWLAAHMRDPDLRIIDASWYMASEGRDAKAEYDAAHIPGARFFDIDEISDARSSLPHMAPSPEKFMSRMRAMGVGDGHQVVVYDGAGVFSAPRVWWLFRLMGQMDVAVLDGGVKKWVAEGREVEDLPPVIRDRHMMVRFQNQMVKDATQVSAASKLGAPQIVDARSPARFAGSEPEPRADLRSGHIPHARNVFFKNLNLNPSFIWNISDHTSLSYQMEILDQEKPLDRGVFILNNDFDAVDAEDFYGDVRDGAHEVKAFGHQLVLNHELNHNWHLLSGFAYRDSSFEGQSSDTELSEGRQLLYTDPSILSRQRRTRDYQAQDLSLRFELSGVVDVAGFVNNVLFGLDYYNYHIDTDYRRWRTAWGAGDTTYSIDPENPDYTIFRPDVTPTTLTAEKQKGLGFYAQDVIELTDATKLLVGFRVDKFEQDIFNKLSNEGQKQDQTEVTPRFGFVYEINDAVSLYTSYAEGFRPNPGLDSDRNAFDPEETTSFEVGAKWENIADMFSGSIAIFDAEKTNMLTAEPNTGFSATLGEVESQGVEFQLTADLTSDIRLDMAYAYIDAKTANEVNNLDWGVPIPKGSRLINIAKHSGYISLNHFTSVFEKEAFFGVTMRYVGDRLGQTTDPTFILPSYTLVNLAGSVNISDALSMRFDVNNLFDRDYFENSYHQLWTMPGSPTNYTVSVKYQF